MRSPEGWVSIVKVHGNFKSTTGRSRGITNELSHGSEPDLPWFL